MKYRLPITAGALTLMLLATISCAGGHPNAENPAAPDLTREITAQEPGHYLWAYYEVYVNPARGEIEILPFRQVSTHWNVLKWLERGPCTNCVGFIGWADSGHGTKLFDVQISHPFPSANLTGFDVRGIAMFAGSHTFPVSGLTTPDRTVGDGELIDADGYTTLYNGTTAGSGPDGMQGYFKGKYTSAMTPNALLNGYMRHVSPGVINTRNAFYAGGAVVATYDIDMPDSQFIFGYAVDASWARPIEKPVDDPMTDFGPEANCPEPWKIEVAETPIGQGLTDQGGSTVLTLGVYDWQGKTSFFAPEIECPELFDGPVTAAWKEDGAGYTRFEATIDNQKIAPEGEYKCLIAVEDTENATAPDWLDLTAYQIVILEVGEYIPQQNKPPTAAAHADPVDPTVGQRVDFYDDSTDPDGADDIIKWEWDFSFDPVDGFQMGSEEQNPSIQYPSQGVYRVQLRVTDTADHTDMLDDPLTITVGGTGNEPPIAGADADNTHPMVNTLVRFYDASVDPDGPADMVFFEWDTDGDSIYDKFGRDTTKLYTVGGDYYVQHRVTDTADNVDDLDEPLLIEVNGPPIADAEASAYSVTMGELVVLTNLSYDDDGNGDIEEVYWDINGNGDYDDPEDIEGDNEIELVFFEGGLHQIGLMVVDEWDLDAELDQMLEIWVEPFEDFCVDLIDQYNSADGLYGNRTFDYYNAGISGLDGLDYDDPNGPWDFTVVPSSAPAICAWLLPTDPEVSTPAGIWPDADFFFKEDAPGVAATQYCPHRFDFVGGENGDLVLQGQWSPTLGAFKYYETFDITHPICHPWFDSGSGSGTLLGVDFDISWSMETLGAGPAIFTVNGDLTVLNCMLIRHHMSFVDIASGSFTFHLLNYQWIDEDGNEVAFMQASNGLGADNFLGNTYTGTTICRALKTIS